MTIFFPSKADILSVWTKEQKINYFENVLRDTGREGIENAISKLRTSDFYTAPSSTKYHSNYTGGLLDHSLFVYILSMMYYANIASISGDDTFVKKDSIAISSLLHDICKISLYKPAKKWTKDASGNWMEYLGYELEDNFPFGHGEKSVVMLQSLGLKMNIDEMLAIRWHMALWEGAGNSVSDASYKNAINEYPLISIIQSADYTASLTMEKIIKNK